MKKIFFASLISGVVWFLFFSYNYANYSKASIIDLNTQSQVYQEMINKQLKEKLDLERIENEKKTIKEVYVSLKISSYKIKKNENIEICQSIWDTFDKVPDPVYIENQLDKEKVSSLYLELRKDCIRLRIATAKKKQLEAQKLQDELDKKVRLEILEKIPTYQQGRNTNTCVIDNLSLVTQYEFGKTLDKKKIYQKLNKQVGDFWYSWLFAVNEYGWTFSPVKENTLWLDLETDTVFYLSEKSKYKNFEVIEERRDWEKLEEQTGLKTWLSPNVWYLTEILKSKHAVLIEVPMSVLYPDDKKWENSKIFHAISVFSYNKETNELVYSNTLTGKVEFLNLDKLKYNENYLKYPFRYITFFEPTSYSYFK